MRPDLSVCIVTYNAKSFTEGCIASIYTNTHNITLEIILVDNASRDGTSSAVSARFPHVRQIVNNQNVGFTRANNQALKASSGRYVVWLNNDTVVMPRAFDRLVAFMDAHPEIGICGPKVLNRDGTMQNQCRRGFPTPWASFCYFSGLSKLFPRSRFFARYLMTWFDEDETHEVDAVSGSCLLARREVMDQIGFLDEDYFAYADDLDWCARAKKAGWKVFYYPEAKILHYGGQGGSGVRPYRSIYHFYRSMWLFYQKHIAPDHFFLFNWAIGLAIAAKFSSAVAVNLLRRQKVVGSAKP